MEMWEEKKDEEEGEEVVEGENRKGGRSWL